MYHVIRPRNPPTEPHKGVPNPYNRRERAAAKRVNLIYPDTRVQLAILVVINGYDCTQLTRIPGIDISDYPKLLCVHTVMLVPYRLLKHVNLIYPDTRVQLAILVAINNYDCT
jgi:hypothetical protein